MKVQIRRSVFETNSSSMHSLVICDTDMIAKSYKEAMIEYSSCYNHDTMLEELNIDDNGVLDFSNEQWDFGRAPFRILRSFKDKLRYFLASYYCFNNDKLSNIIPVIQKLVPEIKEIKLPKEKGYSFDTEYKYRDIHFDEPYYLIWKDKYGFTDEEFLISDKFVVIQDGDEYGKWNDCIRAGLINTKIVKIDSNTENERHILEEYEAGLINKNQED